MKLLRVRFKIPHEDTSALIYLLRELVGPETNKRTKLTLPCSCACSSGDSLLLGAKPSSDPNSEEPKATYGDGHGQRESQEPKSAPNRPAFGLETNYTREEDQPHGRGGHAPHSAEREAISVGSGTLRTAGPPEVVDGIENIRAFDFSRKTHARKWGVRSARFGRRANGVVGCRRLTSELREDIRTRISAC